jgi:hypothetical protein
LENFDLEQEFDIVELEPRQATSPDQCFVVVCGSGGWGSGAINIGIGSGGSGT